MGSARRNRAHHAVRELQAMKLLRGVVTQNVDSLHWGEVVELHGALREVVCLHCRHRVKRGVYQEVLRELNPHWAALENGNAPLRMNPDGDVDLPGAEYTGFRYAPCPKCLGSHGVEVDGDGGFVAKKEAGVVGVLKPGVTFFGESIGVAAKEGADRLVEEAGAVLVVGSSLATYSAWRLVREADRKGKGIGIVNLGGVRGEEAFFRDGGGGGERLRLEVGAAEALAGVVESLGGRVENFAEEAEVRGGGFGVGG